VRAGYRAKLLALVQAQTRRSLKSYYLKVYVCNLIGNFLINFGVGCQTIIPRRKFLGPSGGGGGPRLPIWQVLLARTEATGSDTVC
jgi:hypothetical protein